MRVPIWRPGCCRLVPSSQRGLEGPSPPGLARLGPHAACVCVTVAALTLSAVPSNEKGESKVPPRRVSPGSGSTPPLCAATLSLLLSQQRRGGGGGGGSLPACLGAGLACRDARLGLRIDYALHGSEAVDGAKQREEGRRRPPHRDAGPRPAWAAYRPCVCRGPLMLTAMPSSETEGGGSLPAEPHSARVTHSVCVCPSSAAPSSEREGGRAPSHRASPGSGRAPRFVCRGRDAVGCAKQRGRRQSPPTRQVSPGTGRARPGATP